MKIIKRYVDMIDEELESAKQYAEMYIEFKSEGTSDWANKFRLMAEQEIEHAYTIHELAKKKIDHLSEYFVPPTSMQEVWDKSHIDYIERAAWIKQMLNM